MRIEGLAAIVAGGASGLGLATARMLAEQGAKVSLFDVNEEVGGRAADEIGGLFVRVDVADDHEVADAFTLAETRHGVARILVNCAGVVRGMKTVDRDFVPHALDLFRRTIEVNLIGNFNLIAKFAARAARTEAIDDERGVIVNTASIAAFEGQIGQAAYSASKGGVVGMTLPIARDLACYRIRVMTIAPGLFLTPMIEGLPREVQDSLGRQVPNPSRAGRPSEYAQLVESIIRNPMLNGEVIRIDGAMRMAAR